MSTCHHLRRFCPAGPSWVLPSLVHDAGQSKGFQRRSAHESSADKPICSALWEADLSVEVALIIDKLIIGGSIASARPCPPILNHASGCIVEASMSTTWSHISSTQQVGMPTGPNLARILLFRREMVMHHCRIPRYQHYA